jgi:ribosomal protein S24E
VVPGTSWQEIKAVEEEHGNFFNLSLRGKNGEGHNYYQTVLNGFNHWQDVLGSPTSYNTPKQQSDKGFSIYLPADGRLFVNASAPDSHVPVLRPLSWEEFLGMQARDILQYHAITHPTNLLVEYAQEVEPEIGTIIDRRNFVFSLAYTSMETPALRLYLTIRLLQDYSSRARITFADQQVQKLVGMSQAELAAAYKASGNTLDSIDAKHSLNRDPIIGNEISIYTEV